VPEETTTATIRPATEDDVQLIFDLICELATYEKLRDEVVGTPELLRASLFDSRAAEALIVEVEGEEAHAGTTPRAARKDAFAAATRMAAAMYEATTDADDTLRFTIGRVDVHPGSPNTVPGQASFTIDMRHPSNDVLDAHEKTLLAIVAARAAPCTAGVERVTAVAPTRLACGETSLTIIGLEMVLP